MKLSLVGLTALFAALAAASPAPAPVPGKDSSAKFKSVSQSCKGSQSSIRCCDVSISSSKVKDKKYKVKVGSESLLSPCSQDLTNSDENKLIQDICSVYVACCIGDGCVAIAGP